jgi:hypothetical protein
MNLRSTIFATYPVQYLHTQAVHSEFLHHLLNKCEQLRPIGCYSFLNLHLYPSKIKTVTYFPFQVMLYKANIFFLNSTKIRVTSIEISNRKFSKFVSSKNLLYKYSTIHNRLGMKWSNKRYAEWDVSNMAMSRIMVNLLGIVQVNFQQSLVLEHLKYS